MYFLEVVLKFFTVRCRRLHKRVDLQEYMDVKQAALDRLEDN